MPETVIPRWTFADRLRKVRVDFTDLTQTGMARALGYGAPRYTAWETGRNVPRAELQAQLADQIETMTGIPASWTLSG